MQKWVRKVIFCLFLFSFCFSSPFQNPTQSKKSNFEIPLISADTSTSTLGNTYFQMQFQNGAISSLRIDPLGISNFSQTFNIIHDFFGVYVKKGSQYIIGSNITSFQFTDANHFSYIVNFNNLLGASSANVSWSLNGNSMQVSSVLNLSQTNSIDKFGITMEIPFTRSGYDCSINTTIFSRFYSDIFDYMPIQEFKRRETMPLFNQAYIWVIASGVEGLDYDLNFTNFGNYMFFDIYDTKLAILFGDAETITNYAPGTIIERNVNIQVQPRSPNVPSQYPYFYSSNQTMDNLLNSLLLERVFSFDPVGVNADWFDWEGTALDWMDTPYLAKMHDLLENTKLENDSQYYGYVYSWGDQPGWPFPDNTLYNTRHYTTNQNYILGIYRYVSWTKNYTFLMEMYPKLNAAMNFLLVHMHGAQGLLVNTDRNHEGLGFDANGQWQSLGSNYWDITPFGYKDAYANAYFHGALNAMAEIESFLGNTTAAAYYNGLADLQKVLYNQNFWNQNRGRFIGCIDINGTEHDYGFTYVNMEAIYYGLANASQVYRIYDWMENEPTSSGQLDTFSAFQFAPRATTEENLDWCMSKVQVPFGDQVQDGGSILYTEGYDLRDRGLYLGINNAYNRLQDVLNRYALPDKLCGGGPRYTGETPQQENAGGVGTDLPFPESGLAPASVLEAILGIQSNTTDLILKSILPDALTYMGVHGLYVGGVQLDVNMTSNAITIKYLDGTPSNNFNIHCSNITFDIQSVITNGTVILSNNYPLELALSLQTQFLQSMNEKYDQGRFFNVFGQNQSDYLDNFTWWIQNDIEIGQYENASLMARGGIDLTALLLTSDEAAKITSLINQVYSNLTAIRQRVIFSPNAQNQQINAENELIWAEDALARGNAFWFFEHIDRYYLQLLLLNQIVSKEDPMYIIVEIVIPCIWGLAFVIFIKNKIKARKKNSVLLPAK
jgi:hypothetical protein